MITKAVCGGTWNLAYGLGLALLVRQIAPNSMQAFGLVLTAYGVGNLGAALILGNLPRVRLLALTYSGYELGPRFYLNDTCHQHFRFFWQVLRFTAIGGPMNDIPSIDLIQARYKITEIRKISRLRIALEASITLVGMLVAPWLFLRLGPPLVIGMCGAITLIFGFVGLAQNRQAPAAPERFIYR